MVFWMRIFLSLVLVLVVLVVTMMYGMTLIVDADVRRVPLL
jgi:hypothetical protein